MQQILEQLKSPLPSAPPHRRLSAAQWRTLATIADTIIPSISLHRTGTPDDNKSLILSPQTHEIALRELRDISSADQAPDALIEAYLAEPISSCPGFEDAVQRLYTLYMDDDQRKGLSFLLTALDTRAGALLFTGTTTPLHTLSIKRRLEIVKGWQDAYIPAYNTIFRSVSVLGKLYWPRVSTTLGRLLSFPHTPLNHNFGEAYPFSFVQFPPPQFEKRDLPDMIEADIVIVGSGCGGAVVASVLAQAGLSVIVADKSYYWPPQYLPMSEMNGLANLFANGGITASDDSAMSVLAGSCWGGGGTVNWSASLQLQGFVRQGWAQKGLPYFTSAAFQNDMDVVCEAMGVSTAHVEHNVTNQKLLEGARRLGMNAKTVPQNTGGETHSCGYCTLGCGSCGKKGPTESWLPSAAKAGAQFVEGFEVDHVIFSDTLDDHGDRIATGVQGIWTSRDSNSGTSGGDRYKRKVILKARHSVIISSGTLGTPLILHRSGIKNSHVGAHLRLHPVITLGAVFDTDVRPWEGSILTSVVNDYENLDGHGHGVKLEATNMIPSLWMPGLAWYDPLQYKISCAKMRRSVGYISLARDTGEGRVYADASDSHRARIAYTVSKKDRAHIAIGLEGLAKIMHVSGAREIFISLPTVPPFVRSEDSSSDLNDSAFQDWLKTHIRPLQSGKMPASAQFASAHQMGTARMGTSASNSVVSPEGRVWGTMGLYVADASNFPSASGVNPMITNMAISHGIARGIRDRWGVESGKGEQRARL